MNKLKNLRTIVFCLVLFMIAGCQNPDRYTVTFDANGGKFKDNSTIKYMKWSHYHSGDASECPNEFTFKLVCGNYPKREGYFFVDWTSNQDGTGFSYTPTGLSPSDYIFYAQWGSESEGYNISFDSKGGPPVQDMTGVLPGTTITLPNAAAMTWDSYALVGWVHLENYRYPLSVERFLLTHYPIQNIVFSAVWYPHPKPAGSVCTVKFDPSDGRLADPSSSSKQVMCGDMVQVPLALYDNFSSLSWFAHEYDYVECDYPGSYPIFDDMTFYATWIIEE